MFQKSKELKFVRLVSEPTNRYFLLNQGNRVEVPSFHALLAPLPPPVTSLGKSRTGSTETSEGVRDPACTPLPRWPDQTVP